MGRIGVFSGLLSGLERAFAGEARVATAAERASAQAASAERVTAQTAARAEGTAGRAASTESRTAQAAARDAEASAAPGVQAAGRSMNLRTTAAVGLGAGMLFAPDALTNSIGGAFDSAFDKGTDWLHDRCEHALGQGNCDLPDVFGGLTQTGKILKDVAVVAAIGVGGLIVYRVYQAVGTTGRAV